MDNNVPQLFMRHPDLSNLPPFHLPEGMALHNHIDGEEKNWESLIEKAFGNHFSFEKTIVTGGGEYKNEYVLYISKDGKDIATATAVEKDWVPGEGWFRMIASDPDARGLGAGRLVCLAALHSLAARGYKTAVLSTDDDRIPALSLYYSLGFRPIFTHESHEERWKKVMEKIRK